MTDAELILTNQLTIMAALVAIPKTSDLEINRPLIQAMGATEAHLIQWYRASIKSGFGQ